MANFFEFDLVAHRLDGPWVRADEYDAGGFERLGEGSALGQEAVAGMHGLGASLLAGGDYLVDHEIGFGRWGRADGDFLVSHLDVQRVFVGFRIDRNRLDAEAAGGLDNATGDLAAICDQDLVEHRPLGRVSRQRGCASGFYASGGAP